MEKTPGEEEGTQGNTHFSTNSIYSNLPKVQTLHPLNHDPGLDPPNTDLEGSNSPSLENGTKKPLIPSNLNVVRPIGGGITKKQAQHGTRRIIHPHKAKVGSDRII